jgi:anti-sigma regulatory factor (Ser/Thr protein kinase)
VAARVGSEATGWVSGDAQRVAQIVTNLVANAIKFTRQGGVTVELSREADGRVLISVQDTGLGIAAEQLERIFQPFAQAHAGIAGEFGGTGLGLSIARHLARLMGGDLTVQSRPGEAAASRPDWSAGHGRPDPGCRHARARGAQPVAAPLLAEDNDVNALIIDAMLPGPPHHAGARRRAGAGRTAGRRLRSGADGCADAGS